MNGASTQQPGTPVEIELKLGLTGEAMEQLLASALLREHAQTPIRAREQHGVYYDTEDHRLRERATALRVREVEGRFIQTLKSARAGGLPHAERGEWEVEIDAQVPRPEAFEDPAALEVTGPLSPEALRPVFETRVQRRSLVVGWADAESRPARIELAFDTGCVRVDGGGTMPISELELELVEGEAEALFELAAALRGIVPLRLESLDKAARGWLLASGKEPPAVKAGAVALDRSMRVEDALAVIFAGGLRHWLDNEPAARDGREHEGVHQLRVALRRLRSALALFEEALGASVRQRWNKEMAWLLDRLGAARDLDVLLFELLPPVQAAHADEPALATFRTVAEARRAEIQARLRETLDSQRYADLAFELAGWVARHGWRSGADIDLRLRQRAGIRDFAADVLHRRYRKVLKAGKRFERLTTDERHRVRIAVKKLRYGVEFFAALFPQKRVRRFRKAASRMQSRLGHLNDVAVASRLVRELVRPLRPGAKAKEAAMGGGQLVGWYAHQLASLEPETVAAWESFTALDPFWEQPR